MCELHIAYDLRGVRRHLVRRLADVAAEGGKGDVARTEARTGGRPRRFAPGALIAADAREQLLPFIGIAGRSRGRGRLSLRRDGGGQHEDAEQNTHRRPPYLGCVTTSMSDGSPRLTTSIARFSAGPRSFGFVIGPC